MPRRKPRDPKLDPMPGDIFTRPDNVSRQVIGACRRGRNKTLFITFLESEFKECRVREIPLGLFQTWAVTATVGTG